MVVSWGRKEEGREGGRGFVVWPGTQISFYKFRFNYILKSSIILWK
jgi:hypothetical protein